MWSRIVEWMRLWMLRVTPRVLLRRLLHTPPPYPDHVPVAVHRQHALNGAWGSMWTNTVRKAHAARDSFPNDARVRNYFVRVTKTYAALFGA